ncbi:MAG: SDR family oxidoreductase [Gammaproteobacteria bacterium]|nr:MAG: SDR family oxidoreductase [Gammaproteobacteria bacterium]
MAFSADKFFDIGQRVALVTGAGSGLGRSFAMALAAAGARVAIAGRRAARLDETAELIRARGGTVEPVVLDVTDATQVAAAVAQVESTLGVVDVLVNNAGISRPGMLIDTSTADWDAVIATNLTGVHRVASEVVRRLRAGKRPGSIINIASILGSRVSAGLGPYIAAKAGVIELTKAQALEWARFGIRANAIAPGYFPTEMNTGFFETSAGREMIARIPMRRVGDPADLTGVLLLLASEASAYMTGAVIAVDGGHLCSSL